MTEKKKAVSRPKPSISQKLDSSNAQLILRLHKLDSRLQTIEQEMGIETADAGHSDKQPCSCHPGQTVEAFLYGVCFGVLGSTLLLFFLTKSSTNRRLLYY